MAGRTAILIVSGYDRIGIWGRDFDPEEAVRYPWIELCLREVRRRSAGSDYEVLVWDNMQLDEQRAAIRRAGARVLPDDAALMAARQSGEESSLIRLHMGSLHRLFAAVGPEVEYVITLDTDAFPVRNGWIEELTAKLDHASLTGVWRDEMPGALEEFVHPSCLCIRRERLARIDLPFSFGGVQDVGQRITIDVQSAGEPIEPLRRSNARNAHFLMGGIYGDVVYHHGAGSRKPVFRMTVGEEREDRVYTVLRDEVFKDVDHVMEVLRGQSDDTLGLDWTAPAPVVTPGMMQLLGRHATFDAPPRGVPQTPEELAELEARYVPFNGIADWTTLQVDTERWDRYAAALRGAGAVAPADRANEIADRLVAAAALDSGALAGLFPPNPELTSEVLAGAVADGGAEAGDIGEAMKLFVECNRRALDVAADAAASQAAIHENLIGYLQDILTQAQATFTVEMPGGRRVEVDLPRRQYKPVSNLVTLLDGTLVVFCPASRVAEEMHRLVGDFASDRFANAHPAVQAAFAHYGLTAIHPFADGNGRLARVVASIFMYRAAGVPLVIFADQWPEYRRSQNNASLGRLQESLDRFYIFGLASMDLAANLLAAHPTRTVQALRGSAASKDERDSAAVALVHDLLWIELHDMLATPPRGVSLSIGELRGPVAPIDGFRSVADPRSGRSGVRLGVRATPGLSTDLRFVPLVADDPAELLPVAVREETSGSTFEAALSDVHPFPLDGISFRLRAWVAALLERKLNPPPGPILTNPPSRTAPGR